MNRLDGSVPQGIAPAELLERHLGKLNVPSFDTLSREIKPVEFASYFKERVSKTFDEIDKDGFVTNHGWFDHLNFIYQSWVTTRTNLVGDAVMSFADSIATYDDFVKNYAEGASIQQLSSFNFWTKWFIERIVHPERMLKLYQPNSKNYEMTKRGIYQFKGVWHNLESGDDASIYVEQEVLKEVVELNESLKEAEADLFHATGSSALKGISQYSALLSARESEKRNNPVTTGEYTHRDKDGELPVGGVDGLANVYTSAHINAGYSTVRWFDEFPVVFGFQSDEIEDFVKKTYGWKINAKGVTGDGHKVGEFIPLSLVKAVYTYQPYLNRLEQWALSNLKEHRVISLEAATLLRTRSDESATMYPNYPYRFNEPPITDWADVLKTPAIIL